MNPKKIFLLPTILLIYVLSAFESKAQIQGLTFADSLENYRITRLEKYSERLKSLRKELTATFDKYIEGFDTKKLDKNSFNHLNDLRGDLKSKVISMVENGTSGEAVVAANNAKVDLLMEEINTIEKLFGGKKGAYTNEFNVFNLEELNKLSEKIKSQAVEIEKSIAKLPSNEVPTDLLQRKNELLNRLIDVKKEIKYRQSASNKTTLKAIDKTVNIEHLKANEPLLQKFASANKQKLYLEKLNFQIELRLHNSPKDASLTNMRNYLSPPESPTLKSPSIRPPPSEWKNPIKEVVSEIRNSVFSEQSAIETRNSLNIAKARTNSIVYQNWLKVSIPNFEVSSTFDLLSTYDLQTLKSRNIRWLVILNKEYSNTFKTSTVIEIKEAESRITNIEKSIQRRTSTFPYESTIIKTNFARPPPNSLKNFESKLAFFEKHIEAKQLRLLIDKPIHISDLSVKTAYEKNVQVLKQLESDALTYGKGKRGATVIDELIKAQKSILQNKSELAKTAIHDVLTKTKEQLNFLKRKINSIKYSSKRVVYNQSVKIPSVRASPFTTKNNLNRVPKKNYPVNYQKSFPKNKVWTKSHQGLIRDIKKAPGGVIIDASLDKGFINNVEKVEFDVFTNQIKILINGKWKTLDITKDWTILRQGWAYVNDGRVAVVDLRPFSAQETFWFFDYILKTSKGSPSKMEEVKKIIPKITTVNLHPTFQSTSLGDDLILADQIIFDLLPTEHTRIEGQYNQFRELGLDVDKLRNAYLQDFRGRNAPGTPPRSISKSIISVKSVNLTEAKEKVQLSSRLDFAIYLIPNRQSDTRYIRMENSSNWFNENRDLLTSKISYLDRLNDLSTVIAFFNSIKKNNIENNFYELGYLVIEEEQTPKYLFLDDTGIPFENAKKFLEGKID